MKTTNRFIAVLWAVSSLCVCFAQPVSKDKAVQFGLHFFNEQAAAKQGSVSAVKADKVQTAAWSRKNRDCMYVLNMPDDGGWVLVSGDERAEPILAFSESGTFPAAEDMPPAMLGLLQDYADEILFIQDSCPKIEVHPKWQSLNEGNDAGRLKVQAKSNGSSNSYTPGTALLNRPVRGEVLWDQALNSNGWGANCNMVYNKFCPAWFPVNCGRTIVGCVAVAIGQIMWYWQWPHTGLIPVSVGSSTKELHLYNWDLMPASISNSSPMEQVDMIAGFLRDCGYAIGTKYSSNGSGITTMQPVKTALENTFAYAAGITIMSKAGFLWAWMLRTEINAGRPVFYSGKGIPGDHAFVVDGYDSGNSDLFHINWGWWGANGYFSLDNLAFVYEGDYYNFNTQQQALFGICPNPACAPSVVNNNNVLSGDIYRNGTGGTITVSNSTIYNNGTAVYYSGTSVRLLPGFRAASGSRVYVGIHHFPCNGVAPQIIRPPGDEDMYENTEFEGIETALNLAYSLQLTPNPAQDYLSVQFPQDKEPDYYIIYNVIGTQMLRSDAVSFSEQIQVGNFPQGAYLFRVFYKDGASEQLKFLKK